MKRLFLVAALLVLAVVVGNHNQAKPPLSSPLPPTDTKSAVAAATVVGTKPLVETKTPSGETSKAIANEIIVKVRDAGVVGVFGSRAHATSLTNVYRLDVDSTPAEAATVAAKVPGVLAATPNYLATKTAVPNDSYYAQYQWNMTRLGMPSVWDRTTGSPNVIVASLDTGLNWNHEDMAGRVWANAGEIAGNGVDDDNNGFIDDTNGFDFINGTKNGSVWTNGPRGPMDDEGHGTLTASVLSAAGNNAKGLAGMDWQAKIMPVKVLDTNGNGDLLSIAEGVKYATNNGAKVITMSLGVFGISSDVAMDTAIELADAAGVTIVAASGNDGSNAVVCYPANNPKVIAVGASDSSDNRASYSNAGPQLSVVAPGNSIISADGVVTSPNIPTMSLVAGGSLPAATYRYAISAINANGETVTSTTAAIASGGSSVKVNWPAVSGASGYKVYRSPAGGNASSIRFLASAGSSTTYTDNGSVTLSGTLAPSVTTATKNTAYALASGTSIATPHVAAEVALLLSINRQLTPTQLRTIIQNTADKVPGMGGAGRTDAYGYGRINVQSAMAALPPYAAQVVAKSADPTLRPDQTTRMVVDVKNTGTQSWSSTGPNAVHLGTTAPRDRLSGFGSGWMGLNRVVSFSGRVESDNSVTSLTSIAPGETARFEFDMKGANAPAQTYWEPMELVAENVTWIPNSLVSVYVNLLPPIQPYSAQVVNQSNIPTLGSGDQTTVTIDYKNTGSQTWTNTGPNTIRLGTAGPRDRFSSLVSDDWLGYNRIVTFSGRVESDNSVTNVSSIAPDETARFTFKVTAPAVGGQTIVKHPVQLVVDGVAWLGDSTANWDVNVAPRTYTYSVASQTYPPANMTAGQRATISIDLTNTGTATWRKTGWTPFRLGTSRALDRMSGFVTDTWLGANRVDFVGKVASGMVTNQTTIAPGETARFLFDVAAPNFTGNFREYFQPVVDRFSWLADAGIYFDTFVPNPNGPAYDYEFVTQSPYPTISQNGQTTLVLKLKNTGTQTWSSTGPNAVKLGTSHPQDRGSGFYTVSNWEAPNRIKLTSNATDASKNIGGVTTVAPGEVGEFDFIVSGNAAPGSYPENFQPLAEGVAWMKDIGIGWRITIQKPIQVGLAQQNTVSLWGTGPVTIRNESGNVYGSAAPNSTVTLTYTGSGYSATFNGQTVGSSSPIHADQALDQVTVITNIGDNGSFNQFRGGIYIKNGAPGTFLINDVDFETYMKGLGEVPDSWPIESIKAQIVAARTYAARKMASPTNALFNLYDDTRDQVYNGYINERDKPNTRGAVDITKGVGIFYGGSLIQAFYSSDTGGASESNENVWGGSPIPYLRGGNDPYSKPDNWSKTVTNATLQANFGLPGNVNSINVLEVYPSGRAKTLQFVTSAGTVNKTFLADTMRSKLTTRSSLLTNFGRSGNDWVLYGSGFGHGIGMGQWGAYNQALQGRSWQQILQFYYTGVNFGQV